MCVDFDRFGGFVSISTMRRGLKKFLSPYVSVVMYNEMQQVCVGCEGIVLFQNRWSLHSNDEFYDIKLTQAKERNVYAVAAEVQYTVSENFKFQMPFIWMINGIRSTPYFRNVLED